MLQTCAHLQGQLDAERRDHAHAQAAAEVHLEASERQVQQLTKAVAELCDDVDAARRACSEAEAMAAVAQACSATPPCNARLSLGFNN